MNRKTLVKYRSLFNLSELRTYYCLETKPILLILLLMEVWGEHRGARNARPPDRSERSVDAVMLMSLHHKLCSRSNN